MENIGLDPNKNQKGQAHDDEPPEEDGRDYDSEAKDRRLDRQARDMEDSIRRDLEMDLWDD